MGPNLVFRGGVREANPPLHHRQIFHQNVLVFLVSDRTDGRTDGRTDRRNKYVLGLPCFKKLSSEFCLAFDGKFAIFNFSHGKGVKEGKLYPKQTNDDCIRKTS